MAWALGSMPRDYNTMHSSIHDDSGPQQHPAHDQHDSHSGPSQSSLQQPNPEGSSYDAHMSQYPPGMHGQTAQPWQRTPPDRFLERDSMHHVIDIDEDDASGHSPMRIRGGAASYTSSRGERTRSDNQDEETRHGDNGPVPAGWPRDAWAAGRDDLQDDDIVTGYRAQQAASRDGDARGEDMSIGDGVSAGSRTRDEDRTCQGSRAMSAGSLDEDDAMIGGTSIAYDVTSAGSVADIEHGHTTRYSGTSAGYARTSAGYAISEREPSEVDGNGDNRPPGYVSMRRSVQERPLWRVPHSRFGSLDDLARHLRERSKSRLSIHEVKQADRTSKHPGDALSLLQFADPPATFLPASP